MSIIPLYKKNPLSNLEKQILNIVQYVCLNFLIQTLYPRNQSRLTDINRNFIDILLEGIASNNSLYLEDDKIFLDRICTVISQIIVSINDEKEFEKYQNLICFLCNTHPKGDIILIFLIDEIHKKYPFNPTILKKIISNLQKHQIQIKAGQEITTKPLKDNLINLLKRIEKEAEFAKIDPEKLRLIDVFRLFESHRQITDYKETRLSSANFRKAGDFLKRGIENNIFNQEQIFFLVRQLRDDANIMRLFVIYVTKGNLDKFCDSLLTNQDFDIEESTAIIALIKNHQEYQCKTQISRLKKILQIQEGDLHKTQDDFKKVTERITSQHQNQSDKSFFANLYVLSSPEFFGELTEEQKLQIISNFTRFLADRKYSSRAIDLASIYCLVECQLYLLSLLTNPKTNQNIKKIAKGIFLSFPLMDTFHNHSK